MKKALSVHCKALIGPQDHTHTHTQDRSNTKWYAHMWIRACVYVRSAVHVGSHRVNWESKLVTAGPVKGVEGGDLVLHRQPRLQLNQGLTLIPAPHTDAHEAERRGGQSLMEDSSAAHQVTCHRRFIARSARRVKVGILISESRIKALKPQVNMHPCVVAKWITFATPL